VNAGLVLAIAMAFAFSFTNGIHDAANAIATLVATRAARPGPAVILAAVFNMLGPLLVGAAVADTIATVVQVPEADTVAVVGAGLTAAVAWNAFTWSRGLPSSSSHALVGGLVGAAWLDVGSPSAVNWGHFEGLKVNGVVGILVALALSPVVGLAAASVLQVLVRRGLRRATVRARGPVRRGQWVASAWLAFSHGSNDAQKSVGIVAALLLANGSIQAIDAVPRWVIVGSAAMMTLGTALGGWKIVRTIGRGIFRLRPLDGLVSQVSSASVIFGATLVGAPVSTTQVVASSVVGAGVGRGRFRHVAWQVVQKMLIAWVTTLPAAAVLAAAFLPLWRWLA
jgi:inorganic phosphate transporter, PiT family